MTISVIIKKYIKFSSYKSALKRGENRGFGTVACACLDTRVSSLRSDTTSTRHKKKRKQDKENKSTDGAKFRTKPLAKSFA